MADADTGSPTWKFTQYVPSSPGDVHVVALTPNHALWRKTAATRSRILDRVTSMAWSGELDVDADLRIGASETREMWRTLRRVCKLSRHPGLIALHLDRLY